MFETDPRDAAPLATFEREVSRLGRAFDLARLGRARGEPDAEAEAVVAEESAGRLARLLEARDELAGASRFEPERAAALARHLIELVRRAELAQVTDAYESLRNRQLREGDGTRSLGAILAGVRDGRPDRAGEAAIERMLEARGAARAEALARAESRCRALGSLVAADVDRPREGAAEAADRFLAATDELARECEAYVAARAGFEVRTPFDRLAAVRAADLDDVVPEASRSRRGAALVSPLGFAQRLERWASVSGARPEPATDPAWLEPLEGRLVLVPAPDVAGVEAECAFLLSLGVAVSQLDDTVAVPPSVRRPRSGCHGRALGTLFAREAFDPRVLGRRRSVPSAVLERARRLSAASFLARARLAAAALVSADAVTAIGRALSLECGPESARLALESFDAAAAFDGFVHGLVRYDSLRATYDEDFFHNPRAREQLQHELRRAFVEPFSVVAGEHRVEIAARELATLFEGRHR